MKKHLTRLVMCLAIFACFAMVACAIDTPNVSARLGPSMTVAQSPTTAGTHKFYGGNNDKSSAHAVYFESQRSAGNNFVADSCLLVSEGTNIDNVLTSFTGSSVLWRLELNPYGVGTKNCTAEGFMWYKM